MAHYYPAYTPTAAVPAPVSYFPPTWISPPATWYAQSPTTPPRSPSPPNAEIPSPSPPTQTQKPTSVKVEPDDADGRFIMELSGPQSYMSMLSQSQAPPTEVPLRATQASPEMYDMMGVFRINPFSIHDGANRGKTPAHFAARPLEEEPIVFEWQVELAALETFPPGFEIEKNNPDPITQEWDVDPDGSPPAEPEPDPQPRQQESEPIHAPHPRTYAFTHPRATHPPTWTYPTTSAHSDYADPPARNTLYTISPADGCTVGASSDNHQHQYPHDLSTINAAHTHNHNRNHNHAHPTAVISPSYRRWSLPDAAAPTPPPFLLYP